MENRIKSKTPDKAPTGSWPISPAACQSRQLPASNTLKRLMMTTVQLMILFDLISSTKMDQIEQHKTLISAADKTNDTHRPVWAISPTTLIKSENNNNKAANSKDELPSGGLAEFVDNNYLSSDGSPPLQQTTNTQTREMAPTGGQTLTATSKNSNIQEEISTSASNTFKSAPEPSPTTTNTTLTGIKTRRQVSDNKTKMIDWWTELLKKNNVKRAGTKSRAGGLESILRKNSKPNVYKEQPLNQNPILTFRNQLIAIRDKHRLLISKPIGQLQQLDQRLVDSYRLCLKRKMPLYGGMLYRTRDFVVRMANEVKHQRQVLEAMAKQIQKVLRERIANKTLIKEYNRAVQVAESEGELKLQQLVSVPMHEMDSNKQLENMRVITYTPTFDDDDELTKTTQSTGEKLTKKDKNRSNSSSGQTTTSTSFKNTHEQQREDEHDYSSKEETRAARQTKYTVHIDEVNLKKELAKTQALINRINGSYYELNGVVDDILYLFKLTSEPKRGMTASGKTQNKYDKTNGNSYFTSSSWMSSSTEPMMTPMEQQRRLRKMLKSPLRIYLERYGRLTMGNFENMYIPPNLTDTNNKNMKLVNETSTNEVMLFNNPDSNGAELKPLFDSSSLSGSIDISDQDLGFDGSHPVSTHQ